MDLSTQELSVSPAFRGPYLNSQDIRMMAQECCCVPFYNIELDTLRIDSLKRFIDTSLWQFESG